MSDWWNLKSAIASIDSKLDQAMGLSKETEPTNEPDPTPIKAVSSFEFPEDQLKFLDIYSERFESLCSKIKHLVEENLRLIAGNGPNPAAATAKKIDLLLEEGTRLSAQELKLNSKIKNLRSQVADAAKRGADESSATANARITALQEEIKGLNSTIRGLERDIDEKSAAIEHYKHANGPTTAAQPSPESIESLTQNHEAARENWLAMESRLLATIASLESAIEQRDLRIHQLNDRVNATLAQAQELRRLAQDDKKALAESQQAAQALETKLRDEIHALESEFNEHKSRTAELESQLRDLSAENVQLKQDTTPPQIPILAVPTTPEPELADLSETLLQSTDQDLIPPLHELYDDVGVPPLVPLAESSIPFDVSQSGIGSRVGSGNPSGSGVGSRRSSIHSEIGVDTHLVAKLSQANRKLEAQLLMANESLENTRNEKEAAYADMVKYMTAGENAERLERENKQLSAKLDTLLVKLGQKSERVTELEADVEDLKEMYKDQVTELLSQIEKLGTN